MKTLDVIRYEHDALRQSYGHCFYESARVARHYRASLALHEKRAFDWIITTNFIPRPSLLPKLHGIALVGEVAQFEKPGIHSGTETLVAELEKVRGTPLEPLVVPPLLISLGQLGAPTFGTPVDSPQTLYGDMHLWNVVAPYTLTTSAPYAIRALALMDFRRATPFLPQLIDPQDLGIVLLRRFEQVGEATLEDEVDTFLRPTIDPDFLSQGLAQAHTWIERAHQ